MKTIKHLFKLIYCMCDKSHSDNNLPNPKCINCGHLLP